MKLSTFLTALFSLVLLVNTAQAETLYFHNDHLGTPQALTDKDQNVVWEASYTPFGEATIATEEVENNLRVPGQYFDKETGLHYNYFRTYDPATGRYIESDPIGLIGGLNTYGYVDQNPINNFDPYGLAKDSITARIEALAARGDMRSLQNLLDSGALNQSQSKLANHLYSRLNKINHIFGKKKHQLGDFVESCGNPGNALDRLDDAFKLAGKGKPDGKLEFTQIVGGFDITLRGMIVKGVPRLGTAFIVK